MVKASEFYFEILIPCSGVAEDSSLLGRQAAE
jgi:hypothetical protein